MPGLVHELNLKSEEHTDADISYYHKLAEMSRIQTTDSYINVLHLN